ncbi:tetratricopeptide repeat protein [Nonomuraea rubra]|uniref:NB-ARC domain-containing protein n=1 Tax=Nonomuraea rubra TaxID=46180 RepID=A0A7X0NV38_9ACTN|nr:tetratricopeptide repeat protein [Nonomuraea rubra]MBB6550178.1 hypothetical protein [Nonomuraea rubra]
MAGAGAVGFIAAVVVVWVTSEGSVDPAGATIGLASLLLAALALRQSRTSGPPSRPAVRPADEQQRERTSSPDQLDLPQDEDPAHEAPVGRPPLAAAGPDLIQPGPATPNRRALPDAATTAAPDGLGRLPRPPAAVFLGRGQVLTRLHRTLTRTQKTGSVVITQAAVYGLGGIGKSELALQYAARHRDKYTLVWWSEADNPTQIQASLAELARTVCVGADSVAAAQASAEEAAAWALVWLAAHPGWLLIFDNVEDAEDLHPSLGRLSGGRVLITSRRDTGWQDVGCTPISLEVLEPEAARQLLAKLIGIRPTTEDGEEPAARELARLAEELGFLPLALRQAGAFIARTPGVTVTDYRRLLHQAPDGEEVLARVWAITRQRIAERDALAPRLLALLACYAPDQLPVDVLHHLPEVEPVRVGKALALLASYSMITISNDRDAVSVHRLVQAVTLADLSGQQRRTVREEAASVLAAALPENPTVIGTWALYGRLLPHARTALAPESDAMNQVIDYLKASGAYATAMTVQHHRYRALLDRDGPHHLRTLVAQAELAYYTAMVGDVVGARDQFAALLPIRERVSGAEHPDTLAVRANLARWSGEAGDAAGARDQLAELVPIRERVSGAEHPDTLNVRAHLAYWWGEAGDAAGARDQSAALLPIRERVSGAEHPDTLTDRANLAYWSGRAGDVVGARDQSAALLSIRERVLGAEHPDTLADRANLARWSGEAGDVVGARDQFAALVPIRERVSGAEHPDTLADRANLARWSGEAGDVVGARDQFAALVPIRERVSGAEHPDTLTARAHLAYWTRRCEDGNAGSSNENQ